MFMAEKEASKDEQIGFHKGAFSTLAKERQEVAKMLSIVEQLMQMHVKALKELGVDLVKEAEKMKNTAKASSGKPIEDMLRK
jgi:thiaminase